MSTPTPSTPSSGALQSDLLAPSDRFARRHLGPNDADVKQMLSLLGLSSLDELIAQTVPQSIRLDRAMNLPMARGESDALAELKTIAAKNKVLRSMIGQGYSDTITPPVILRNILENPGWYTQYTPYQPEISQGRMEALINFQTMIADLTALPLANASLLDEPTAAAEAMAMCKSTHESSRNRVLIARDCHPQTIAVVKTRMKSMHVQCDVVDIESAEIANDVAGILIQYPNTHGRLIDYSQLISRAHQSGALAVMACDLLALTLVKAPGEFGADIAVGSAQRFGVPMGFGGPHAGFMSTKMEFARKMPGRLIGVSRDVHGDPAYRLTLQTREQHIRREKATSNICTAQVLLAIIASMYAVYHGPQGLKRIAMRVATLTDLLARALARFGHDVEPGPRFDTIKVKPTDITADQVIAVAQKRSINLRRFDDGAVGISLDETTTISDVQNVLESFAASAPEEDVAELIEDGTSIAPIQYPDKFARTSEYLKHPVFSRYHCETEMLRYIFKLSNRDLSLAQSMIPLGSCTMKLNATSEMIPITWNQFGKLHPFAPADQWRGYAEMFAQLEKWLAEITGFAATSLQPNAGSQGEYAGLLAIRGYHESRGQGHRNICLIPTSAHGTNPASAVIAGFNVVSVACDAMGSVDLKDLEAKAKQHAANLACVMVTYPSTHGVFEAGVKDLCRIVHEQGGQVYMDGANMNAQVGLCRPGDIGADVCHLNLHKTFCIPHGGGGPGMGPICVARHLAPFLPARLGSNSRSEPVGPVSGAPYGSASILPISWMYIAMMGGDGLTQATRIAILNANYMAKRLEGHYDIVYRGEHGRCAHEFIVDLRPFETSAGVKAEDVAKRLMDFGFHAPTMSWPVPGTLMIEPTESESKEELDRFCEAMILIRQEIAQIESGRLDRVDNPLKHAPHTAGAIASEKWNHKYTRQQAAYPAPWLKDHKFWPFVGRVDNPYGDRNLFCACIPVNG